jgi:hypothetical protein
VIFTLKQGGIAQANTPVNFRGNSAFTGLPAGAITNAQGQFTVNNLIATASGSHTIQATIPFHWLSTTQPTVMSVTMNVTDSPLPSGFIALSETNMNWSDAKVWCQQKGGRLPSVEVRRLSSANSVQNSVQIDGFGLSGVSPWPSGLPRVLYWTATTSGLHPLSPLVVGIDGHGTVSTGSFNQSYRARVVCVP